jgi:hypothetical protein
MGKGPLIPTTAAQSFSHFFSVFEPLWQKEPPVFVAPKKKSGKTGVKPAIPASYQV